MMLRTPFEEELEKLHNQFYAMGTEVAAQLKKAVRAFISHDRDLAKEVIENDEIVNNYETKLEKKSLEIIALQQPVSSDLRTVITALKASSDVERMGDHAVAIAKATIRIKGEERLTEIEAEIKKMGKAVRHMVEDALDVYLNSDERRAYEIAPLATLTRGKRIEWLTLEPSDKSTLREITEFSTLPRTIEPDANCERLTSEEVA